MGVEVDIGETGQIDVPQLGLSASQFRLPLLVPAADQVPCHVRPHGGHAFLDPPP